jgi:hypothetical protein
MSAASTNAQAQSQTPKPNPALKNLALLVGKWNVELAFPQDPSDVKRGQVAFEWLEGGAFVVEHFGDSTWIIGPDDSTETYCTLYHDGRGVSRVYQMTLKDGVWKLWRNTPDFSQRFTGEFSNDGNTITADWEKSKDGAHWEHDFKLTYTRIK